MTSGFKIGCDICSVQRVANAYAKHDQRLLNKIFSQDERVALLKSGVVSAQSIAARFAGKEAVAKAFGTGVRGFSLSEIEIFTDLQGAPFVKLSGRAKELAATLGIYSVELSLSHEKDYALAFAVSKMK